MFCIDAPLLNRRRYISEVKACYLTPHHFLLSLRTTAGTYVKEWVHGDLGRTVPSVKSILYNPYQQQQLQEMDSETNQRGKGVLDITQLDVTWLYDSFSGGGNPPKDKAQWERHNWALNAFTAGTLPHVSTSLCASNHDEDPDGGKNDSALEHLGWDTLCRMTRMAMRRKVTNVHIACDSCEWWFY